MIQVYTDGATHGNPGVGGVGIYIKENNEVYEYSYQLPKMSNHEAEFQAVIKALDICQNKFPNKILSFRSDSKIVVDILEKNHTKNKAFQSLLKIAQKKVKSFPHFFIKWIPQKKNQHADRLAKKAMHASIK